jgi:hypothetical protein
MLRVAWRVRCISWQHADSGRFGVSLCIAIAKAICHPVIPFTACRVSQCRYVAGRVLGCRASQWRIREHCRDDRPGTFDFGSSALIPLISPSAVALELAQHHNTESFVANIDWRDVPRAIATATLATARTATFSSAFSTAFSTTLATSFAATFAASFPPATIAAATVATAAPSRCTDGAESLNQLYYQLGQSFTEPIARRIAFTVLHVAIA